MNEVKRAFVEAYERTADALANLLEEAKLSEELREAFAQLSHADYEAKARLSPYVEMLRNRAAKVRRGDVSQGDWPLFRGEDAAGCMAMYEEIRSLVRSFSSNEVLVRAVDRACEPLREVVERYAVRIGGELRFPQESADPVPPFEPPPDPNL